MSRDSAPSRIRCGVDIGGTFTDIVFLDGRDNVHTCKVSSTPDDYSCAIVAGITTLLRRIGEQPAAIELVVHATTVATNTILEHKGARTALLTTQGFRDVLEMRRLRIPVMYDLQYEKPRPLAPRRFVFEVPERLGPRGEVWQPLDEAAVRGIATKLRQTGIQAVAICFLHAYMNGAHEQRVAEILRAELDAGVFITASSDILPEIREYERASTAVVNAYVGPIVHHYLSRLESALAAAGVAAPLSIMHSGGGVMSALAAMVRPAAIVESGPAAGVIAAARVARQAGLANAISFDMGGTTAKAAIIEGGEPAKTTEYEVGAGINLSSRLVKGGGYPIKLPFIDVSEIGAGGGSLIKVDANGVPKVGPESAGAAPGPVCYGLGGEQPTLTDALLVLGYLNPGYLVGGALAIDRDRAAEALQRHVAVPLGKPLLEAAHGVYQIAAATMTRAVKAVTTYRGRDPRDFVLIAFGGNGPVVAVEIARALQIARVLVPLAPGVFSALGLLLSDPEHEFVQTVFGRVGSLEASDIAAAYARLEQEARQALVAEGLDPAAVAVARAADMRYSGQAYEIAVPVPSGAIDLAAMARRFGDEHERTYGHRSDSDSVDLVSIRALARATRGERPTPRQTQSGEPREPASRLVYFGDGLGARETTVLPRVALAGRVLEGPLIIEEYDATCVVPPGATARLDGDGNIDISVGGSA
ncbi:MAG: hydantoinase/oxoprolinase family protein [Alphaproteobacteria bacterium]|nr:hydantoinase/oxoprolinase family protein [Alphaproteobacteria bacterium]